MDNETGLAILNTALNGMSYPNRILTTKGDKSTGIDVKDLHKILLTGCYYPPELQNNSKQIQIRIQTENNTTNSTRNGKEIDNPTAGNDYIGLIYCPVKIEIRNQHFVFV